jgi:hypothetical protein
MHKPGKQHTEVEKSMKTHHHSPSDLSRRDFFGLATAGAIVAMQPASLLADEPQVAVDPMRPDWSKVRGFNYQPSFGRNGIEIWCDNFNPAIVDRELGLGRQYFPKMNTVRLWLSPDAFIKEPKRFAQNFDSALKSCEKYELKAVPVLFNNWHSVPDFGGISTEMIGYWFGSFGQNGEAANYVFRPYLEAMFKAHASDSRILAWDLCNEPFNNGREVFVEWLKHTYHLGKTLGAKQPISVSAGDLPLVEPFSDVLMIHPYFAATQNWDSMKAFSHRTGKALLATECCWGAIDDAKHVEIVRNDLDILVKQNVGFLVHAMHESYVADLHRPEYGPVSSAEYMAFINMDGSLRAGHDVFNQYCN